nr:probable leucine-rich repeat receptor-like protein kinase At1g35710 [Ziziphus jujuba var. spinosa]
MFCSSSSTATNLYTSSKTSRGTLGREERVEVEAKALVKWKESLDNQTHVSDILSSWKLFSSSSNITRRGNISLCQWFGITCNEFGSVLYINLESRNLKGELPMEFRNLRMLETLKLSHNNLSGEIPSAFDNMRSLTFVDVSYNQLEGPLPSLKAFTEAPKLALESNKGLCGNNASLKPCSTSKESSNKVILNDYDKAIELEWTMRVNVINGLANAMYFMHHECFPTIIHRDISSKNVLLDSEYEAHISKFGSAIICDPESSNWTSSAGTFGYVAPELDCTMEINKKSDVYNFGVVTMEALLGKHPGDLISYLSSSSSSFAAAASEILLMDVLDPRLPLPTMQVAAQVASIVEIALACLHPIPQSRPTMKQVSDKLLTTTPLPSLSRPIHTITLKQ